MEDRSRIKDYVTQSRPWSGKTWSNRLPSMGHPENEGTERGRPFEGNKNNGNLWIQGPGQELRLQDLPAKKIERYR